ALAGCASVWKVREALAEAAANVPDTRLREQFRRDFADLAILWSEASQRLNGRSSSIAAPAAVEVLNEVDRLIGPTRAVAIERDRHRRADPAGLAEVLAPYEPAWEFFVVG